MTHLCDGRTYGAEWCDIAINEWCDIAIIEWCDIAIIEWCDIAIIYWCDIAIIEFGPNLEQTEQNFRLMAGVQFNRFNGKPSFWVF